MTTIVTRPAAFEFLQLIGKPAGKYTPPATETPVWKPHYVLSADQITEASAEGWSVVPGIVEWDVGGMSRVLMSRPVTGTSADPLSSPAADLSMAAVELSVAAAALAEVTAMTKRQAPLPTGATETPAAVKQATAGLVAANPAAAKSADQAAAKADDKLKP